MIERKTIIPRPWLLIAFISGGLVTLTTDGYTLMAIISVWVVFGMAVRLGMAIQARQSRKGSSTR